MNRTTITRNLVRLFVLGLAFVLCTGSLRAEGRSGKALATDAPAPIAADHIVFQARIDAMANIADGSPASDSAARSVHLQLFDHATDGQPVAEPTIVHLDPEQAGQIRAELPLDAAGAEGQRWLEVALMDEAGQVTILTPRHALGGASRMATMEGSGFALSGMTWRASTAAATGDETLAETASETQSLEEPASYGQLMNISTRGYVGQGDEVLIAGFIVDAPTVVMVRALGPSLAASGVPGALSDPEVEIYSGGMPVAYNDDWVDSELSGAIANTFSLAPADPRESVLIHVLDAGAYTAIVRGYAGDTGIGLVEVFQLGQAAAPQAQVTVNNQTGAALCYEVHGSGIGERCFGPGVYTYGVFEAGTYAFTVRGACGISREVQDYPQGYWSHSFWCEYDAGAGADALGQQLDAREQAGAEVR